jgi:acetyl-CoA synthetase
MLKLISEEKVNTFCAPPTIYKYLILEDLGKYDLNNLRYVVTAGEPMPKEVSAKFTEKTGLVIREGFGQTETALQICTPIGHEQVTGSIGLSSPLYKIALVDENNDPVPVGEEGEIVIISEDGSKPIGIFKGYLGDEELYREVWSGGVYHTKDKAIGDQKGNYFFLGRNDDVIKSSGYRIGPSEVEDILMRHPAVFECAVTGFPSKTRGSVVKASIILKKGYEKSTKLIAELQEFVKKRAAIYKYPRIIQFVDELPRSTSGKISRAMIRKMDEKAGA